MSGNKSASSTKGRLSWMTPGLSLALMDGLKFSARTVGVDKGAEWHER